MQPKPELIRLSGYAGGCRRLLCGLFNSSFRTVFPHHFSKISCVTGPKPLSGFFSGMQPVPLILFSATYKASRKGGFRSVL